MWKNTLFLVTCSVPCKTTGNTVLSVTAERLDFFTLSLNSCFSVLNLRQSFSAVLGGEGGLRI